MDQLKASEIANYYAEYKSLKWASEISEGSNYFEPKLFSVAGFEGVKSRTKAGFSSAIERAIKEKIKARIEEIEFLFKVAGIEL